MNTERLHRLPSYRELQAKQAAEEIAQLNRRRLSLPFHIALFNGKGFEIGGPAPKPTEEAKPAAPAEAPTEQPEFRAGDRLVCVDNESKDALTLGGTYLAERDSRRGFVRVRDDTGCLQTYFVERFEIAF